MKTSLYTILLLAFLTAAASSQEVPANKYAFSMQPPKGWYSIDKTALNKNLAKFEFTQAEMDKLMSDQNSSFIIAAFHKYDPKTTPGIIPTIQINARPNKTRDFATFKAAIVRSIVVMSKVLEDFRLVEEPSEVTIGGTRGVLVYGAFVMKTPDGKRYDVRSRTYSVPQSGVFIQMNFTDSPENEDCAGEFDELIKTIKIG